MSKSYIFSKLEMEVIRDALIDHWQTTIKHTTPNSLLPQKKKLALPLLIEQFKQDVSLHP